MLHCLHLRDRVIPFQLIVPAFNIFEFLSVLNVECEFSELIYVQLKVNKHNHWEEKLFNDNYKSICQWFNAFYQ